MSTLGKWIRTYRDTNVVSNADQELAKENERLRRENRLLREEREVLKRLQSSSRRESHEV
jgi:transposase